MELILQDIESIKPKITRHFEKYPNASISAMFRTIRKTPALSFFGDYPMIAFILEVLEEIGIKISKRQLFRAIKQSKELKGQRVYANCLLKDEIAVAKKPQVVQKRTFITEDSPASLIGKITNV